MEKIVVKIEKLDHYGRGIGKKDVIPIFIDNALIDEIVEVEIIKKKKNYMEGKVIQYIKQSNIRVNPICPYFKQCGGCDIMHLPYSEQLKYKENKVKEILMKFANINCIQPIIGNSSSFYRNKITLQVDQQIGFYQKKSYQIVPIDHCFISNQISNQILLKVKKMNIKDITKIVIRTSSKESMVVIYADKKIDIDLSLLKEVLFCKNKEFILKGNGYIIEELLELKFAISATSFFQVNYFGMIRMYQKVLEYAKLKGNERILDLYCGTGTIGLYLSKYCGKVLGIEINPQAIKDALYNKKLNDINNIDFKVGDVSKILQDTNFEPDVIVVDPPRAGLDSNTIAKIIELNPSRLIYVSCDPVTFARDLKILNGAFKVQEITPVDMFANTYHVECVGLLERC